MDLKNLQALVDSGFSLLWLKEKSKAPVESNWTERPRKTYDELVKQYKKNFNIGVRLGEASRLLDGAYLAVIDVDLKSDNEVHKDELHLVLQGLPFDWAYAPQVLSGRGNGSFHIYVKTPKPLVSFRYKSSNHKTRVFMPSAKPSSRDIQALTAHEINEGYRMRNAWEVDFIGTGKQVVLPPSIHPDSGKEYQWSKPFDIKDLVLINPENFSSEKLDGEKPTKKDYVYQPTEVDLISSKLKPDMIQMIVSGEGTDKYDGDSEALFAAVMAMLGCGFTDDEIISVLTDTSFYLGEVAARHTKSNSVKRWAHWLYKYNILKARNYIDKDRGFDTEAVEIKLDAEAKAEQDKALKPRDLWRARLEINENGTVKPNIRNVRLILENANDTNVFSYNDFTKEIIFKADPIWAQPNTKYKGRAINDFDISTMRVWLSEHYRCEAATNTINDVTNSLAFKNYFHPVRNYLAGLKWDGIERLDYWLQVYMNAEGDSRYLSAVGRKTLVAAVARIFEPAKKFDQVLILEGDQGVGKSTAIRYLASDEWFTDQLGDISNKDALDKMRGVWLIELGELASFTKHEVERLKEFVSATTDRFRPAYGRRTMDFPRQCIFIGTTNNDEYLRDTTGNRRYWPVKVGAVDMAGILEDRDQLWAEAYARYLEGEKLYIDDKKVAALAVEQQISREQVDDSTNELHEAILTWASGNDDADIKFIPAKALYSDILNCLDTKHLSKQYMHAVANSMRVLGYKSIVKWQAGRTSKVYIKVKKSKLDSFR